jgi:membrane fusion protein
MADEGSQPGASKQSLFRTGALATVNRHGYGSIVLARPISVAFYTGFFSVVGVLLLAFFFCASYQRKVHVTGILLPEAGLIQITSPQSGVIAEQIGSEGAAVVAGAPIFVVVSERTSVADGDTATLVSTILARKASSFSGEKDDLHRQSDARIHAALNRANAFDLDATRISEEIALQETRIKLAQASYQRFQDLANQHFVSNAQLQDKQSALLEQQQRMADLERAEAGSKREAGGARAEAQDAQIQEQRDDEQIARSVDSLHQDMTENEARRKIALSSPSNGTLMSLRVSKGQSVQSGEVLAVVYPQRSSLDAELYVPSKAAGFLKADMDVLISYRSYPYEKFGFNHGVVREVSGSAMRPGEMMIPEVAVIDSAQEPVYRVRVSIDQQAILVGGIPRPLRPGMLLDARIPLERRKIFEWALGPLFDFVRRA